MSYQQAQLLLQNIVVASKREHNHIGKATHPLQVFIPPRFLIFDVLTFCYKYHQTPKFISSYRTSPNNTHC